MNSIYYFEVTDTFGGEANYCWVRRYNVSASSMRGAIGMVNKEEGFGRLKKVMSGELHRWDVVGACICIFGAESDEFSVERPCKTLPEK